MSVNDKFLVTNILDHRRREEIPAIFIDESGNFQVRGKIWFASQS